ncbi:MAG: hypothetical protein H7Z43_00425, partial [Clostridia bacterium]|nr:hypothetical protein [Deltaproteobacteria bacterium]
MKRLFLITGLSLASVYRLFAAEEDAEARASGPSIEGVFSVSAGGALIDGNRATYEARFQRPKTGFGGIEKLRYRRETKLTTLALDGRLMAGEEDYRFNGRWTRDEKIYVDFGYSQFRTFYDGSGKYFAPANVFFQLYDEKLHVDRAKMWLELGFTPEDLPRLKLRYERLTREGMKPSTELGDTNLTGGFGARSIVPAYLQLDETRDILTFDAGFEDEAYQWEAGLRYERGEIDNARQNRRRPTEATASRAVTTRDETATDIFSSHAFIERRFGEKLLTSAGAMASTLDLNLSGSRLYGANYDPVFDAAFARRQSGDLGFFNLSGDARLKQYVTNLNAVYRATNHWTIHPSLRY